MLKTVLLKNNPLWLSLLVSLLLVIAAALLINQPLILLMILVPVIIAAAWLVNRMGLQTPLLVGIVFLLPFSIKIAIPGNAMLHFPTEILIVLALLSMLMQQDPVRWWKEIIRGEMKWILPLAAAYFATIPFSEILTVSLKFSFINILYIMVFYILLYRIFTRKPQLYGQMVLLYTLGLVMVSGWALFRYSQWEWNPVVLRGIFEPFYNDHTIYGASAALLAAWWLGASSFSQNFTTRLLALILGTAMVVAVMFSTSRAAFLSLFVFFTIFVVLHSGIRWKHAGIGLAVLVATVVLLRNPIADRISQTTAVSYDRHASLTERTRSVANVTTDISNVERLNRWIAAWRMFTEKPITGFGPGTYQFTYTPFQEPALENKLTVKDPLKVPEGSGGTAHSEYLLALSEMGILGLLGWLIILLRWAHVAFTIRKDHPQRKLIMVAFAALTTYFFHAFFNNFLSTEKFAFLFWGTAAWMMALYNSHSTKTHLPNPEVQQN